MRRTDPRYRAFLWGVIAALAFLVLAQGYNLLATERITSFVMVGVAVVVGCVSGVLAYITETTASLTA
ncbi:hypothetical protein [Halocatena pleomorpha]|uniref:DUF7981 domain-containing protein n=1 Tax=Halocatena pleomorpha TaxID=1785090 RepID=A0A3P3REL0_9EURY|nr:hypothetical protein [Halocatena pleomorpha]RRJ31180.1 hypothetical protein EIK79_08085 [Halocatena pleomorpha]